MCFCRKDSIRTTLHYLIVNHGAFGDTSPRPLFKLHQQHHIPIARASLIRVGSGEYNCLIGEKIWDDIQGDWN